MVQQDCSTPQELQAQRMTARNEARAHNEQIRRDAERERREEEERRSRRHSQQ